MSKRVTVKWENERFIDAAGTVLVLQKKVEIRCKDISGRRTTKGEYRTYENIKERRVVTLDEIADVSDNAVAALSSGDDPSIKEL